MKKLILSLLATLSVSAAVADNIAYAPDKKITVVPFSNRIWYQKDGDTKWSLDKGIHGEAKFNSVIYAGGKFVAVANMGTIWYSEDGINWSIAKGINNNTKFNAVTYTGAKYVAVGFGSTTNNSIFTSVDGVNWNELINDIDYGNRYTDVISDNGGANAKIVAVGERGTFAYSTNGGSTFKFGAVHMNVEPIHIDALDFKSVTYGNGKFVAVGSNEIAYGKGKNGSQLQSSIDGQNWTAGLDISNKALGNSSTLNKVTYIPEKKLFVAVGNNSATWYSENGINWESGGVKGNGDELNFKTIAYGNGMCLATVDQITANAPSFFHSGVTYSSTDCRNWSINKSEGFIKVGKAEYDLIYNHKMLQIIVRGLNKSKFSCTTTDGSSFNCQEIKE